MLDDRNQIAVDDVSFTVQAGEIVGIAGVQGNGQTELVEALTGLRPPLAGRVTRQGARRHPGVTSGHAPPPAWPTFRRIASEAVWSSASA